MIKKSSTLFASIWDPHQNILLPPFYLYLFLQLFLKYTASAVWFHLVRIFSLDHRCTIPNDPYFLRDSFPDLECQTLCVNRKVEIRSTDSGSQESVRMVNFFQRYQKIISKNYLKKLSQIFTGPENVADLNSPALLHPWNAYWKNNKILQTI